MSDVSGLVVLLYELTGPDWTLRLSTLRHAWTDPEGRTWLGGGAVLSEGPVGPSTAADGGSLTVTLSGADQAIVAEAQRLPLRAPFWRGTVILAGSPLARVHGPLDVWSGYCEHPEISHDPSGPRISLTATSFLMDLARPRRTVFSPETQRRVDPDDISAEFVASLKDKRLDFD